MGLPENLLKVQQRVRNAAIQAGRDPTSVRLLAASKRTDAKGVVDTIGLGHTLFGENRAQSLRDKFDVVYPLHPNAEWHFIGYLQKNKVKYVVGRASMVHSVDSIDLAGAIARRITQQRNIGVALNPMKVLVQIKLGSEESKTGITPELGLELCHQIAGMPELELCGLMNITPLSGEPEKWFSIMADLAERGKSQGLNIREMSMGMSGDLEMAIQYGSTIVRIGSDIYWAE